MHDPLLPSGMKDEVVGMQAAEGGILQQDRFLTRL